MRVKCSIHKEKLERALELLAQGRNTREVSRETGLSFSQLKHVRKLTGAYVDVKTYEQKLKRLRTEKRDELERLERLDEEVKHKEGELKRLVERLEDMRRACDCYVSLYEDIRHKFVNLIGEVLDRLNSLRKSIRHLTLVGGAELGYMDPLSYRELLKVLDEWQPKLERLLEDVEEHFAIKHSPP